MSPQSIAGVRLATATGDAEWGAYWERLEERAIFSVEAADYVTRLTATLGLHPRARVLDFGCGFGFVARLLAGRVREVWAWDASAHMRRAARARLGAAGNVRIPDTLAGAGGFDLVLLNSVAQYMTAEEFDEWLEGAPALLAPGGRIVLSDLLTGDVHPLRELGELLRLSARGGVLLRILWQGLCELRHYARTRRARPLARVDVEALSRHAERLGLSVQVLDRNLAYRSGRTSVVLGGGTRRAPSQADGL